MAENVNEDMLDIFGRTVMIGDFVMLPIDDGTVDFCIVRAVKQTPKQIKFTLEDDFTSFSKMSACFVILRRENGETFMTLTKQIEDAYQQIVNPQEEDEL